MHEFRKIAVAISGGVDSAVTALLLKRKGFSVEGVFMQNWDITDEKGFCSSNEDFKDALIVCKKLNVQLHHVNFVKQYWNEVFYHLIKEYETGYTPNPDIMCNKKIKFNYFYKYAMNNLKADAIATGHYAKTSFGPYLQYYKSGEDVKLYRAEDIKKDQTFFLCQIEQEALRRTMFPLGNLTKSEVKQIAFNSNLEEFAKKPESMGICFIGSRNFQNFIQEYIPDKPGLFVNIDNSKVMGEHRGIHQWTLGQRAKLQGLPEAFFIARKCIQSNIIYVASGTKHPILHSNLFFGSRPHWIHSVPEELDRGEVLKCDFKFQHTEEWTPCEICKVEEGLIIKLIKPKRAITPGQYAVFSRNRECLVCICV
ncbi:mitochondrial tRNA-specific 2-thiouridylase 1 isoform X2 [Anoplophora glabripennis]|uniref:mitochondrial tRNA-specific 2-thiouridylase 1 isoform X2 n=1 Tax=Anoplophora glabripennis TaxID=217634 RepID=UPI000C76FC3F|nr:mitochondrial tRNA-specific 2-thiouridylase 1 isoform X2 [Anoplophora glabripennis]